MMIRLNSSYLLVYLNLFLLSFAIPIYAQQQNDNAARLEFERANLLLEEGEFLQALSVYDSLTESADDKSIVASSYFKMGGIYAYFLEQRENAFRAYQRVLEKADAADSLRAEALYNSGMLLFEMSRYTEAMNFFRDYIKSFPEAINAMTAEFMLEECELELEKVKDKTPTIAPEKPGCLISTISANQVIRVRLLSKEQKIDIGGTRGVIFDEKGEKVGTFQEGLRILRKEDAFVVDGKKTSSRRLVIKAEDNKLSLNDVFYRGEFVVLGNGNSAEVINQLICEDYLRGVLPKEVPSSWSKEALKAQAISARTYALFQVEKNVDKGFDVSSTTASQVYGGLTAERETTNGAIDETRGMVMCYQNKLIISCFHSNSGGYTEASENVWVARLPYLQATEDPYSSGTPAHSWSVTLSAAEIGNAMNKKGYKLGNIKEIEPLNFSASGRPVHVKITGNRGEEVIKSNDFRVLIGAMTIKSTRFAIRKDRSRFHFEGKGFGHGVGLPQWSAKRMSDEGFTCQDILKNYFRGVDIVDVY